MAVQVEYLNNPIPDRFTVENLFYGNAGTMRRLYTVQFANHVPEFVYVIHAVASTKSPTLQNPCSTPAAIAGVQRIVLCRFTKL